MLTRKEIELSNALNVEECNNDNQVDKILEFEKKYNKNSIEILNQKENLTNDFIKWQLLVEKIVYFNNDFYKINKISDILYLTYSNKMPKNYFSKFLDEIQKYVKENPNTIFLMSNNSKYYKNILGGLNHRDIITLFLTNNKEDLYLEYTNVIVQYSENIKDIVKALNPKTIQFDFNDKEIE